MPDFRISEIRQERLLNRRESEIMGTKCCQLLGKSSRQLFPSENASKYNDLCSDI